MILSWGLFYVLHSALAASKLKRILKAEWPTRYKWYRLLYTLLSIALFLGILIQATFLPIEFILRPTSFGQYAGYLIATVGVIIMLRSMKQISVGSFLGINTEREVTTEMNLIVTGIYSQIRHPLYLGLVLIFSGYFLVSGTVGAVIHLACLITYLPFGIYFEEKNLVAEFGESYRSYQKEVPAFFPRIHKKRG